MTAQRRLLVVELWGIGDLTLALPFIEAASSIYQVTVLGKPHAHALIREFAPSASLIPFDAPWARFRDKYRIHDWPWKTLADSVGTLRRARFDVAVSARRDARDHTLMLLAGATQRVGYPHLGSRALLTDRLRGAEHMHRYDAWREAGRALGVTLPPRAALVASARAPSLGRIVVHTGAAQPVRVWPLDRVVTLVRRLEADGFAVTVICDADQKAPLAQEGCEAITTNTIDSLIVQLTDATAFIGNDSGPGHVAARMGIPTFTIFGPQLPELFLPVHHDAAFVRGGPCPYKPCFDSCRYPRPHCIEANGVDQVYVEVRAFLASLA